MPINQNPSRGLRLGAARAILAAGTALAACAAFAQGATSPVGLWKTVDDETKQAKSLVRILEQGGVLIGRVEKILTDKPDAKCDLCTDERKGQPVQGMTIVTGMKREGDLWDGGSILDPNNGKVYRSRMKLLEGGRKLEVRGYVGAPLFGRSQTWLREE
ncbi:MAG TPA: DUF2147 domain-containing protein [Quisquiliibacterium sp.]|nr:DUF2147 domain-containing protein [Quisquiliibacterium sp.]